jgi:hypothetical protein
MIQIRLDPACTRPCCAGHVPTPDEAWEEARVGRSFNAANVFKHTEVEIIDQNDVVRAVATLDGLRRYGEVMHNGDRQRYELLGTVKPDDKRIGQPTRYAHPSRNPVAYY